MSKCVVFVEGQAEQIFVREMLLRRFCWDATQMCVRCYKLNAEQLESAEYDYGEDNAPHVFQLINAGGDNKVLSAMIARADGMKSAGFEMIVGLRDMYSKAYRELSANAVSEDLNREFIEAAEETIEGAGLSDCMKIHFAIMEVETWMLALLDKWKGELAEEDIALYFDSESSMETIFHPAVVMKDVTTLLGDPYEKHKDQVNAIMASVEWTDYWELYESNRCPSFNSFLDTLLNYC